MLIKAVQDIFQPEKSSLIIPWLHGYLSCRVDELQEVVGELWCRDDVIDQACENIEQRIACWLQLVVGAQW